MFEIRKTLDINCVRQIHTNEEIERMCEIARDNQLAAGGIDSAALIRQLYELGCTRSGLECEPGKDYGKISKKEKRLYIDYAMLLC